MDYVYLDLETTGPDSSKDRIVQLAIKVVSEEGEVLINKSKLYNPEMPISKQASEVHGIKDKDVKDAPTFKEDAKRLKKLLENKILVGYNLVVFDIPILLNEFDRAGVSLDLSGKIIDVYRIEQKIHQRTLSTVYRNYTGKELDDAHDALADINATHVVLEHQLKLIAKNAKGNPSPEQLEELLYELSGTKDIVDFYGKFSRDDKGYLTFKFGKHKGKRILDEPEYADWMLKESFPSQVKNLIVAERKKAVKQTFSKSGKTSAPASTSFMNAPADKLDEWRSPIDDAIDDLPF